MKPTKTNLLKNAIALTSIFLILITASSFITKDKKAATNDKLDYYFYMEANIDDGNYNYKTRHVSSILYYAGYETCSNDYDFKAKAERAFKAYLEAEYSCKRIRVTTLNYNVNNKLKTRQQAQEKMNGYIAEEKERGNQVVKTNFSYSCE